jgi:hypothetical protein
MSDDRTKADKDWEARQEAARYRIFNAKRPMTQTMRPILPSWTGRATPQKPPPLRSPGTRLMLTC